MDLSKEPIRDLIARLETEEGRTFAEERAIRRGLLEPDQYFEERYIDALGTYRKSLALAGVATSKGFTNSARVHYERAGKFSLCANLERHSSYERHRLYEELSRRLGDFIIPY